MSEFIYRGQNEAYSGIQASGFRPYKGGWYTDSFYDIDEMKKEYYNKVISKLSSDEKNHFLAFCQHHGLPTNLVDFTKSPLVSLFFACSGKTRTSSMDNTMASQTADSVYAEIYCIDKKRLIDLTELLTQYNNQNFFEMLIDNKEFQQLVRAQLEIVFEKNKERYLEWIANLIECYVINKSNIYGPEQIYETDNQDEDGGLYIDENNEDYIDECEDANEMVSLFKLGERIKEDAEKGIKDLYVYILNEVEDENITHGEAYYLAEHEYIYYQNEHLGARIYLILLINLLQNFSDIKEKLFLTLDIYFMYQPPDLFSRIINQKGLFIYQPYLYYIEDTYNFGVLNYQMIVPDIVIEVHNYEGILEELNFLGINLESMYGDFDNIAKSVRYNNELLIHKKNDSAS